MPEYKYPKLLTVDTTFFNGESPSPTKFNGIFKYINMAFNSLEIFLGNGIDYAPTTLEGRDENKTILNLSSAIGRTGGNIYNTLNLLPQLYDIYKSFGSSCGNTGDITYLTKEHCSYNSADKTLLVKSGETINIPIMHTFNCDLLFGLFYWYKDVVTHPTLKLLTIDDTKSPDDVLYVTEIGTINITENDLIRQSFSGIFFIVPKHFSYKISSGTYFSHISISAGSSDLIISSMYLIKNEDKDKVDNKVVNYIGNIRGITSIEDNGASYPTAKYNVPFNNMYCIGYESVSWNSVGSKSPSYCTVKKPCEHASYCNVSTGINCIGNTYDIFIDNGTHIQYKTGQVICAGTITSLPGHVHQSLQPLNNSTSAPLSYSEKATATTKTIQAPILIRDIPHTVKYTPIAFITGIADIILEPGRVALYDTQAVTSPMKHSMEYNILIKSTSRPDILVIEDSNDVIANNTSGRYFIVGGTFGLSDALDKAIDVQSTLKHRSVAVYAD